MMEIVKVTDLTKRYGNVEAVRGISFSIQQGEIFGFLGPNGAGKTSTINMLTGLARPTSGHIIIDGIDAVKDIKKVQSIIGIVPDDNNLYDEMDGFENLCFCAALYGMEKSERERRARELLEKFNLATVGKRPFKAYSKGMKRKLTIAAGIIHNPKILFLDEPTTGIDVESARQIRQLILDLKRQGTTIFITTHYIEEAERICDRIAFIVNGKIVKTGTVEQLMQHAQDEHIIELKLSRDIKNLKTKIEDNFKNCRVEVPGENSCLLISKEPIKLSPVLQFLDAKGVSVYEAKAIKPTLEDVFVKVTGIKAAELKKDEVKKQK